MYLEMQIKMLKRNEETHVSCPFLAPLVCLVCRPEGPGASKRRPRESGGADRGVQYRPGGSGLQRAAG